MCFGLYPLLLSAYRKGFRTQTTVLKVQNNLLMAMDHQRVLLLVLLDLSADFDTEDLKILRWRIKSSFGVNGTALEWF